VATVVSPQVPVWRMASLQSARVMAWGLGEVWEVGADGAVKLSQSFG
jgi:hypothetical protein